MQIEYRIEENLNVDEFIDCLIDSTLGERRPVNDKDRIAKMLTNANLIVTARTSNLLIGVSRSITDFSYCTYLSDLAVRKNYQHKGIGKELIRRTKLASEPAKLILLSAPAAIDYYPKIGMTKHNYCYLLTDVEELK
ncbi:MAG: GNAT family N-acetyltransferase [Ignavibacteriales bacterium]|nr:GNAT family N-acetyltransferase [Ignavibacteriales bacterium]